jgi:hypothetical protein
MSIFNINWNNVVENLIPSFWRETKTGLEARVLPYLRSIIKPLQDLSDVLYLLEINTKAFLDYTGQDLALENYLNDNYDNTQRRIFITENNVINGTQTVDIYLQGESDPSPTSVYLQVESGGIPFSLYLAGEAVSPSYNFTINIPSSISFDSTLITRQIKNYSEASRVFNIITF